MNEFKTREECLRYWVDTYNEKRRWWEREADFEKLLPMLDNPPKVSFDDIVVALRIRLDDEIPPQKRKVIFDRVMEYVVIRLAEMTQIHIMGPRSYSEVVHYFENVWREKNFSASPDFLSHEFIILRWLICDKKLTLFRKKLWQLLYGPEEKPSSAAPAKKKPSASAPAEEKPSPVISDEEVVLQLYPLHFKNEETAKRFVEQIKNMEGTQIMKLVNKYVPNECIDSSINLYRILYKAGYITTKEKNWYKNVEIKKK